MKLFEQKSEPLVETTPQVRSCPTQYSQPPQSSYRNVGEQGILYAGFVHGEPGFILRKSRKDIQVAATRENSAKQKPGGFAQALGRL